MTSVRAVVFLSVGAVKPNTKKDDRKKLQLGEMVLVSANIPC